MKEKVVVSAYACAPAEGSEAGVGWAVLLAWLDLGCDVTLITRQNNTEQIRQQLQSLGFADSCEIVGLDLSALFLFLKRVLPLSDRWYYLLWQLHFRKRAAELVKSSSFNLGHHVTYAVDWMPTLLSGLGSKLPIIWGPVGGASSSPRNLLRYLTIRQRVGETMRQIITLCGREVFGRSEIQNASLIVAQNEDDRKWAARLSKFVTLEPNVFAPLSPDASHPARSRKILGVGRLVGWKGWILAIEALTHLPADFKLDIIGSGPDKKRLIRAIRKHGLSDRVSLVEKLPRSEVISQMAQAHCLVHPSFHDSAAGVLGEAFSVGCPVVALNSGGSGLIVAAAGGIAVDQSSQNLPNEIASAILQLGSTVDKQRWSSSRLTGLLNDWEIRATANWRLTYGNK